MPRRKRNCRARHAPTTHSLTGPCLTSRTVNALEAYPAPDNEVWRVTLPTRKRQCHHSR